MNIWKGLRANLSFIKREINIKHVLHFNFFANSPLNSNHHSGCTVYILYWHNSILNVSFVWENTIAYIFLFCTDMEYETRQLCP